MLFNSYEFLFAFLPATLLVYFVLNRFIKGNLGPFVLVLASLYFYAHWKLDYLLILLGSLVFNFILSKAIRKREGQGQPRQKGMLYFGVTANLLLLGYYKYANFFLDQFTWIGYEYGGLEIVLPRFHHKLQKILSLLVI